MTDGTGRLAGLALSERGAGRPQLDSGRKWRSELRHMGLYAAVPGKVPD